MWKDETMYYKSEKERSPRKLVYITKSNFSIVVLLHDTGIYKCHISGLVYTIRENDIEKVKSKALEIARQLIKKVAKELEDAK